MKRFLVRAVIVFGCISIASASTPAPLPLAPLTSVRAVRALSNDQAAKGLPVAFQATVTYFRGYRRNLFVQDGDAGVFVKATTSARLVPGDRVLIKGTTSLGFRPAVVSSDITLLGHGKLPKPVPVNFDELIQSGYDSTLVITRGVVESAEMDLPTAAHDPGATLRILLDGGYVDAQVESGDAHALGDLLDAQVAITAVAGGKFDGKMQLTGIVLHVASLADIKIIKAAVSPWSLPITPMDQILSAYHVENRTRRVRVSGTASYFEPGSVLVLQNGANSIWIKTQSFGPMRIGDLASATGFPAVNDGFLMLYGSAIQDGGVPAPVSPEPVTWPQLASSKHIFDLVSIEGQVVMEAREESQDEYVLVSDGKMFSAVYPHGNAAGALAPMKEIPVGARMRVTGICVMDEANPFGHDVPFKILLRTTNDLVVLSDPSWMTVRNLSILVLFLLLSMLLFGARALFTERALRRQMAALAYVEQRRGRILEDINNSRPLVEIIEEITELVSASLKGVPCWCQITDGARLGNYPSQLNPSGLRIAEHAIGARPGPALGTIFAAFDSHTSPRIEEEKTLAMAAELATLAIETSRLHSDLVHRSEFDMLTDIQNRFSFERHLDGLIEKARHTAGIFGLIYIDLNGFKQVNDLHGHQVGDLYLQQVAERMKRQVRPGDLLARLGGDEFGVLVPVIHRRSDVEEIASRLECCFDDPVIVEGHRLLGSASVGFALYPEDATTRDALLSAADTAMYARKNMAKATR